MHCVNDMVAHPSSACGAGISGKSREYIGLVDILQHKKDYNNRIAHPPEWGRQSCRSWECGGLLGIYCNERKHSELMMQLLNPPSADGVGKSCAMSECLALRSTGGYTVKRE